VPEPLHGALLYRQQGIEEPDGGGLACAVGTEKPEHLTLFDGKVDAGHGEVITEAVA
jgi:hypothetical protein